MSLLVRLLLLIGIASLPAIAIVAYNEIELRHAREADVRDQALRLTRETASELERTVEGVRGLLVTLAELPVVRESDGAACTAFLTRLRRNYPEYLTIEATDVGGTVFCDGSAAAHLRVVGDLANVRRALATGTFAVGEYQEGPGSDRRLIVFAYPFHDDAGQVAGTVLAGLDLEWLGRRLAQRSMPPGTALAVTDRNGTFLVRLPDYPKWVGRRMPDRLFELGRGGGLQVGEHVGADGVVRISAAVPVAFGPGTDLVVAVGLSEQAALRAIERATGRDIGLIVAGLVLASLTALVGGRYFIRRPIAMLAGAASRWREGDYAVRTNLRDRRSELGRLAETFDAMAEALAQREAALRTADERLRLAADATRLGTWDVDLTTGRRVWSDQFRRMFGLPTDSAANLPQLLSRIHPDDLGPAEERFRRAQDPASGGVYENEFRIRRFDDGSERWMVLSGRIFFDAGGRPVRGLGILLDITERKRAEDVLRHSEAALRLAVETTGLGLWEHDLLTRKLTWSDRTKAMFGLPPDAEVDLKTYRERLHPDDYARVMDINRGALDPAGGGGFCSEQRVLLPDGTVRWLLASGRVLFDAEGRAVRVIGGSLDITERKQAEEATLRMNEVLEERVEERTRALSAEMRQRQEVEATLRQAQKMQAIGQLAGGVAHDFNNLLTAVGGNLELLEQHVTQEPGLHLVRWALRAVDRGAQLTQRLLAFSRKQHLQPKPVDVNRLVSGMADMVARTLGGTIQVRMALSDGLWRALVDPTQIELALLNLAINSRDAMPDVGILTISTRNAHVAAVADDLAPGAYVVLAVTDTGTGMSDDVLGRAFEPFFTTKDIGKGTGLGLSQVYGVISQLGGTVRLRSRVGEGTTAELYLPRSDAAAEDEARPAAPVCRRRDAVVMVVDDDADVRALTVESLSQLGYRVVAAVSGAAALALIDEGQPVDLLIADFAMPGMNGRVLANEAKARRPGLRVIHVTGYATSTALVPEPDEILVQKPFRIAELAQHVAEALEQAVRAPGAANVVRLERGR